MPERSPSSQQFPVANFVMFLVLAVAIMSGWPMLTRMFNPPQPQADMAAKDKDAAREKDKDVAKGKEGVKEKDAGAKAKTPPLPAEKPPAKPQAIQPKPDEKTKAAEKVTPAPEDKDPQPWITLGSADPGPANPYRMLVTLSKQGAAVARIELSDPRYRHFMDRDSPLDDRSGYLGHVVMQEDNGRGAPVQAVGAGTPAEKAGLKVGDRITEVDGREIAGMLGLKDALEQTKPGQTVQVTVLRGGKPQTLEATLIARPLEVVRPENGDPLSLLTTLQQLDGKRIPDKEKDKEKEAEKVRELEGVNFIDAAWRKINPPDPDKAVFQCDTPDGRLRMTKTYTLARVPQDKLAEKDYPAYDLTFDFRVENLDKQPHTLAYRLDGPNGLPTEGWWYASKVSRDGYIFGSAAGLRDVIVASDQGSVEMRTCTNIADGNPGKPWINTPLKYVGVDGQYFSSVLIPERKGEKFLQIADGTPIRVGAVDAQHKNLTNISFRLISKSQELQPGEKIEDRYTLFAGPKERPLLENEKYGLGDLNYYGWFGWVAKPMLDILHFFYKYIPNYGIAIILLTVLVRLCMFPFSRKQALNAQKMQELQPQIVKLKEKYKKDMEGQAKAQRELFQKHNYSPLSGCLVLFIQLPIFVGLYRSLMVDVQLRDASLLGQAIRWCSNLSAPDMLLDWHGIMPEWVNMGSGMFGLGPYFNLLPILTIVLFIVQQKMFMPPATDEQTAMQQKIMKYMMIFMGLMFYKVAAGLCIYFIASSLWGLAERKVLPKTLGAKPEEAGDNRPARLSAPSSGNGEASGRKKNRKKK